jgi:RAD54-like protein 2
MLTVRLICSDVDSDVIELSSGDEDALQISSESADEEAEGGGTQESSGAHVNDALNQPDTQGRVLVNINHPADEEDLYLAPQLARAVKPHQVGTLTMLSLSRSLALPPSLSLNGSLIWNHS